MKNNFSKIAEKPKQNLNHYSFFLIAKRELNYCENRANYNKKRNDLKSIFHQTNVIFLFGID